MVIFKTRVTCSYTSTKYYTKKSIMQWICMYKPYTNVKGFIIRIFGLYINIRDKDATAKLIKIFQQQKTNIL